MQRHECLLLYGLFRLGVYVDELVSYAFYDNRDASSREMIRGVYQ
jgi:hypothetical protein